MAEANIPIIVITDEDRRQTWERATAAYGALPDEECQRIKARFAAADRVAESIGEGKLSPFYA